MKNKPQEYKEKSKNYFEKISSDYSNTPAGKYTKPMHHALTQELYGKISRHYWMWDVEMVPS